jgi:hypothetical protein
LVSISEMIFIDFFERNRQSSLKGAKNYLSGLNIHYHFNSFKWKIHHRPQEKQLRYLLNRIIV